MRKFISAVFFVLAISSAAFSQTCSGYIYFEIVDSETSLPIGADVSKSVRWFIPRSMPEFFDTVMAVMSLDEVIMSKLFHDENEIKMRVIPQFIDVTPSKTDIEFKTYCGYYLIQLNIVYMGETMNIGFYNVPHGVVFSAGNIPFEKGDFYFDLKNDDYKTNRDYRNPETGLYTIPLSLLKKF